LDFDPIQTAQNADQLGFGFPGDEPPEFDLGPPGPPEPPDIDLLFPEFFDEFFIPLCLFSGRVPVSRVGVELILPSGDVQRAETDEHGHAGFVIKREMLRPQPGGSEIAPGLGRARLVARFANKEQQTTRTLWLVVARERNALVIDLRKRLLEAHESLLKAVGGRAFFISGDYRNANTKRRESIVRIASALDRLLNVVKLLQAGSAITPIQRLLGLPRSSGPDAITVRIQAFFTDIEERIAGLKKLE
jgi:hypothetical protein